MTRVALILILAGAGAISAAGEPDANDVTYAPPNWADPDLIVGAVLPWVSGDPEGWECVTGKGVRPGTWSDPDGHGVDVNAVTAGWSVVVAPNGQWTLTGDVGPGANYIVVEATDRPGPDYQGPLTATYTVLAWGLPRENHAPILASNREQGRLARMRWKQRWCMASAKRGNWLALRANGIIFINCLPR